uniref:Uncharacterized protein n=1 Tax=Trichogramma kaykai TaxID=54128 RepID=A0ABD2WE39_9HYME
MFSARVLILTLVIVVGAVLSEEAAKTNSSATSINLFHTGGSKDSQGSVSRRAIEETITPPKSSDYSPWIKKFPLNDIRRGPLSPPRVTEDVDEPSTERPPIKKTRTVGPVQDSEDPSKSATTGEKDKSTSSSEVLLAAGGAGGEQQLKGVVSASGAGPAPRFHGNRPSDDRCVHGWRSSGYHGFGKDKYYDHRDRYPYDRFGSVSKPNSDYSNDGDRYSQRPSSNYEADRFGSATVGGGGRPLPYQSSNYGYGGYRPQRPGISASQIGEGEADNPYGDGPPPDAATAANIQTQKAVALKALAGVALIGAAAALASNPVLLPISVISGKRRRRRRSTGDALLPDQASNGGGISGVDNYALTALLQGYIQAKPNKVSKGETETGEKQQHHQQELVISPECVARLACNVHRDYLLELDKNRELFAGNDTEAQALHGLEHWFDSLVHSNILVVDYLSNEVKTMIQSAVEIGSNRNATCDVFSCLDTPPSSAKSSDDKKTH